MEIWDAIKYVSGGASLAAFIAGVVYVTLKHLISAKAELIKAADGPNQVKLVEAALEVFPVNTEGLSAEQKFQLALEQIKQRAARFTQIIRLVATIFIVGCGVFAFSLTRGNSTPKHTEAEVQAKEQLNAINLIFSRYLAAKEEGAEATNEVLTAAPAAARALSKLSDDQLNLDYRIVKYSYRSFALAMTAKFSTGELQKKYASESLSDARRAIDLVQTARSEANGSHRWLDEDHEEQRLLWYVAMCQAIEESAQSQPTYNRTKKTLYDLVILDKPYVTLHDPSQNSFLKQPWEQLKLEKHL